MRFCPIYGACRQCCDNTDCCDLGENFQCPSGSKTCQANGRCGCSPGMIELSNGTCSCPSGQAPCGASCAATCPGGTRQKPGCDGCCRFDHGECRADSFNGIQCCTGHASKSKTFLVPTTNVVVESSASVSTLVSNMGEEHMDARLQSRAHGSNAARGWTVALTPSLLDFILPCFGSAGPCKVGGRC